MFASINRPDWRGGAANMGNTMRAFFGAGLIFAATASGAYAQTQPPMPVGYDDPGPKPTNLLPPIVIQLRNSLSDPYSIRDFQICDPKPTQAKYNSYGSGAWMRAGWMITISLNAKNRMGGYAGRTAFLASFAAGRLDVSSMASLGDVNARLVAETITCRRIPDSEIQRLMQE